MTRLCESQYPATSTEVNGVTYYSFTLNQDYNFPAPGVYGVPIIYTSPDIESCDNSREDIIYVQVLPAPKTNFSVSFSGCSGDKAMFQADSLTENGIRVNQWIWNFHDSTTVSVPNPSLLYNTAGAYSESLRTITADGCVGDTTKTIIVRARPVIEVVEDSLLICTATDTAFVVLNPGDLTIYTWYTTSTGGTATAAGVRFPVTNVTDTMTYYVEAMEAGCASINRKQVLVSVLPALASPVPVVDLVTGDSVRFKWAAVPSAVEYEVSLDSGQTYVTPSSGATGLTHTVSPVSPLQQISIMVRALGINSCQTGVSAEVSACTPGTVQVTPASVAICTDSSASFSISSPDTAITYNWYATATGGTPLASGPVFTVTGGAAGASYFAEGVSAAGCTTSRTQVNLTVNPLLASPVVTVDSAIAAGDALTFRWTPVNGATGYEVSVNGGPFTAPSSGATGLLHVITGLSAFQQVMLQVRALAAQACQTSLPGTATGSTRTDMVFIPNTFTPNGDGRNDRLQVYSNVIRSMNLMIFNQWGQKIFETNSQQNGWDGTYNNKQQPVGVYIYVARITLLNGSIIERKGSINLVR